MLCSMGAKRLEREAALRVTVGGAERILRCAVFCTTCFVQRSVLCRLPCSLAYRIA